MKSAYLLASLLTSFTITASPLAQIGAYGPVHVDVEQPTTSDPSRAPDPPPAPTPLPPSTDGVLRDGSIINYTPDNPTNRHQSCWTPPLSRPPPSHPYKPGTCTVCIVQRASTDANDKSATYQLWARDAQNNAMGNLGPTAVYPLNEQTTGAENNILAVMPMGGSPLLLRSEMFTPGFSQVEMVWARPPRDAGDKGIWEDEGVGHAMFDPAANDGDGNGDGCVGAGSALGGGVRYAECFFEC